MLCLIPPPNWGFQFELRVWLDTQTDPDPFSSFHFQFLPVCFLNCFQFWGSSLAVLIFFCILLKNTFILQERTTCHARRSSELWPKHTRGGTAVPGSLWNLRDEGSNPSCSGPMRSREKTVEHTKCKELGESMKAKAIHWKEWRMETEWAFKCELTNSRTLQPSTLATCTLTPPGGQKGKHFNSILCIWAKSQQHKRHQSRNFSLG